MTIFEYEAGSVHNIRISRSSGRIQVKFQAKTPMILMVSCSQMEEFGDFYGHVL